MTIPEAYEVVIAPFAFCEVYEEAERIILEQCCSVNQRALYYKVPLKYKQDFLVAIVKHMLYKVIV